MLRRASLILVLLLVAPASAEACVSAEMNPGSAKYFEPGAPITITGTGFNDPVPATPITLHWASREGPVLGAATAGADGTWTLSITVPAHAQRGQADVIYPVAYDQDGQFSTNMAPLMITVGPPPPAEKPSPPAEDPPATANEPPTAGAVPEAPPALAGAAAPAASAPAVSTATRPAGVATPRAGAPRHGHSRAAPLRSPTAARTSPAGDGSRQPRTAAARPRAHAERTTERALQGRHARAVVAGRSVLRVRGDDPGARGPVAPARSARPQEESAAPSRSAAEIVVLLVLLAVGLAGAGGFALRRRARPAPVLTPGDRPDAVEAELQEMLSEARADEALTPPRADQRDFASSTK